MERFTVGQRVKYSEYVIREKRHYWNNCGREPMKSGARKALDDAISLRGTVTAIFPNGIEVRTDSGAVHQSLDCLWDIA